MMKMIIIIIIIIIIIYLLLGWGIWMGILEEKDM